MKQDNTARARLMLVSAMVIFGTIGILRKYIPLSSSALALSRSLIGTAFLVLVLVLRRRKPDLALVRRHLPLLALSGALIGFNWILLFEAYNYTSVATATLCYYMAPVFVTLLSPLLLRERLTGRRLLCCLAALAGMVLVSGVGRSEGGASDLQGILLGLGAAVLYASVVLLNKRLSAVAGYDRTVVQLAAAAVVLIPYTLLTGGLAGAEFTPPVVVLVLVAGVLHTGVAYAMYFGSMGSLPAQTVALFSYVDPVVAIFLSAVVLREGLDLPAWLGAVLILGSTLISELPGKTKESV